MREPRAKAVPTVRIDNDEVRVTEWRFPPGGHTGHHRHEYPYVVVPLTTGPLEITSATGNTTASLTAGDPYFRPAGAEHDVINPSPTAFAFIEIEIMGGSGRPPSPPTLGSGPGNPGRSSDA